MRILRRALVGIALALLVGAGLVACSNRPVPIAPPPETGLRLGTLNVHYIILRQETGPWSVGDWERRKGPMDLAFKAMDADIVAFQEMESFGGGSASDINLARDWLLERNPGYRAAADGDPAVFPNTQPIFYRADRMTRVDQGWFFFSETPDVIYSRTFNGSYPAFASWALFDVSGKGLRVVNVHTDFASLSNRRRSLELVAERVAPWIAGGERVVVMGDFNAFLGGGLLGLLEEVGVGFVDISGPTYHLNRGLGLFPAVDHVGLAGEVRAPGPAQVIRQRFDREWPTDHYPVVVDVVLD